MLIIAFYWPIGKKEVCGWRIVSSWLKSWSFVWNFRFGLSLSRGHIYCASLCTLGHLQTLEEIIEVLPFRQVVAVQPIGRNQKMPNYLEFCGFKKCDQRSIFWQFRIASVSFLFYFSLFHFGPDRDRVENLKFFKFILLYMFGRMKFIFVNGVEFGLQQNLKMLIRVGCIVFDIGDWLIK